MKNSKEKKFYNQSWFTISVLFIVATFVGGFFYREFYREVDVSFLDDDRDDVMDEVLPDGKRIFSLKNSDITIIGEDNWVILFSDNKTLSVGPNNTAESNVEGFDVTFYPAESVDLLDWVKNWVKNSDCPKCYPDVVKINDKYFKLVDTGALGYMAHYFILSENKIIQVSVFNSVVTIDDIFEKIKF